MLVFICGLYRSGTTITWKTLAQDKRFVSFDEPFSPFRADLPELDPDESNADYLDFFNKNPREFRSYCAPIYPQEYLSPDLTDAQVRYIKWFAGQWENMLIDFTRCNYKLEQLRRIFPEAIIIHLSRQPAAFVTSHVTHSPRAAGVYAALARKYRKFTFFTRTDRYNFYSYEDILEKHFGTETERMKSDVPTLKNLPLHKIQAYVKLLLLHRHNRRAVDKFATRYPEKFLDWQFENFLISPESHLQNLYDLLGMDCFSFDFSRLRSPNYGYRPHSDKWDVLTGF